MSNRRRSQKACRILHDVGSYLFMMKQHEQHARAVCVPDTHRRAEARVVHSSRVGNFAVLLPHVP